MDKKSLAVLYTKEVYRQKRYHGTWLPNETTWALGDIVTMADGVYIKKSSLLDKGVFFDIEEGEVKDDDSMSFSTSGTNENKIEVAASVSEVGKAQTEIKFNNEFGVVFKTKGYKISRIVKQDEVEEKMKVLYRENPAFWKKSAVIMELVQVNSGTVIISSEKNASITLEANVEKVAQLDIADAKLGVKVLKSSSSIETFIAKNNFTPLFRLSRLAKAWLVGDLIVKTRDEHGAPPKDGVEVLDFEPNVSIDDLMKEE